MSIEQRRTGGRPGVGHAVAHYGGQIAYATMEAIAFVLGRRDFRRATSVARRASHRYWQARAMWQCGRADAAFSLARSAYNVLREGDREATFSESAMIAMFLDKVAAEIGMPDGAHAELTDARDVLVRIHADETRRSAELENILAWLRQRITAIERAGSRQ